MGTNKLDNRLSAPQGGKNMDRRPTIRSDEPLTKTLDDIDPKSFDGDTRDDQKGGSKLMESSQANRIVGALMERLEKGEEKILTIETK